MGEDSGGGSTRPGVRLRRPAPPPLLCDLQDLLSQPMGRSGGTEAIGRRGGLRKSPGLCPGHGLLHGDCKSLTPGQNLTADKAFASTISCAFQTPCGMVIRTPHGESEARARDLPKIPHLERRCQPPPCCISAHLSLRPCEAAGCVCCNLPAPPRSILHILHCLPWGFAAAAWGAPAGAHSAAPMLGQIRKRKGVNAAWSNP